MLECEVYLLQRGELGAIPVKVQNVGQTTISGYVVDIQTPQY